MSRKRVAYDPAGPPVVKRNQLRPYCYLDTVPTEIVGLLDMFMLWRPRLQKGHEYGGPVEELIRAKPDHFKYVEPLTQTHYLCMVAVALDDLALSHVQHKTPEICAAAVAAFPEAFRFVPQELQTEELLARYLSPKRLCYLKVKLADVRPDLRSPEVVRQFVRRDRTAVGPEALATPESTAAAVASLPVLYRRVQQPTEALSLYAVHRDVGLMQVVPERLRTLDVWKVALVKHPCKWVSVAPREALTPDICRLMLNENVCVWSMLPDECRTPELARFHQALFKGM